MHRQKSVTSSYEGASGRDLQIIQAKRNFREHQIRKDKGEVRSRSPSYSQCPRCRFRCSSPPSRTCLQTPFLIQYFTAITVGQSQPSEQTLLTFPGSVQTSYFQAMKLKLPPPQKKLNNLPEDTRKLVLELGSDLMICALSYLGRGTCL